MSAALIGSGAATFTTSSVADAFAAAEVDGGIDRWIRLADRVVRLRFADDRLLRLTEAFAHLECDADDSPALTIHVWDSPGTQPPFPPSDVPDDAPHGLRIMWQDGDARACHQPGQQTLSVLDIATGQAWFWVQDEAVLPYWEHAAPARMILSWWLHERGCNLVHGAAVGTEHGGALIVGKGGSGKSTTALLSLLAGLSYASDDYVVVEGNRRGQGPYVHSAFGSGKLDERQAERFPELATSIVNPQRAEDEKAVFLVNRYAPERMTSGFPLRTVIVPRISGRPDTSVRVGSALGALSALAPSTIFQIPGSPGAELKAMAEVVRSVPCHVLDLGTDFAQIPQAIAALLEELDPSGHQGHHRG